MLCIWTETQQLQEAERELAAARGRAALKTAAKRLQQARAMLKRLEEASRRGGLLVLATAAPVRRP
jgi:hypothetical protein